MHRTGALLAALIAACTAPTTPRERVAIAALRCSLDVPAGTAVALADDGATFTTRPGARVPRQFSVHARPSAPGESRRTLAADVAIAYTLRTADGGSGGAESVLEGRLQAGARSFAVTCNDQAEAPLEADATWCFVWLATLRVDD